MVDTLIRKYFGRVVTPRIIQMEATECGAAALGIVMSYYGCYQTLETLREMCGVSRDGVNAFNMIEAAKHYGFQAEGFSLTPEKADELPLPSILHWDENHFVVLNGITENRAYINDPATGPRTITRDEFSRRFSGVALTLEPGPEFQKQGRPPSILRSVWQRVSSYQSILALLVLIHISFILFGLVMPGAYRLFLDRILNESGFIWKKEFIVVVAALAVVHASLRGMEVHILNLLQIRLGIQYSTEFLWHMLRLPYRFFTQRYGGEIINRMGLNNQIAAILSGDLLIAAVNILFIGIYGAIIFQYDLLIGLIGCAVAVFNMLSLAVVSRLRNNAYALVEQKDAQAVGVSLDALQHMESIKCASHGQHYFERIAGIYTQSINQLQNVGRKDIWLNTTILLAGHISTILLFGVGIWRIMYESLTIGMLIALQILLRYFISPFEQLAGFGAKLQTLHIDIQRLEDVLANQRDPLTQNSSIKPKERKDAPVLAFDRVKFSYAPLDDPLIHNFSLEVEPEEWIGLVGQVGSGKSTIAKLACGLYLPNSGKILVHGNPLQAYSREQLTEHIDYVDQEIVLFSGSVRDNITLWDPSIPEEEIKEACKKACILDQVESRADGLQEQLIENGRNFSEGERQRLELARMFLGSAALTILDEATSALDAETENKVLTNLKARGGAALLICHRLNPMKLCDRIVVLKEGRIVESGPYHELKEKGGLFKSMLEGGGIQ